MSDWLDNVNQHANDAAVQNRLNEARKATRDHLRDLSLGSVPDATGRTVRDIFREGRDGSTVTIVFTDGHYLHLRYRGYGDCGYMEREYLEVEEAYEIDLLPVPMWSAIQEAKDEQAKLRNEITTAANLRGMVDRLGKDKVLEILNGTD
jgi:hypothetical protein